MGLTFPEFVFTSHLPQKQVHYCFLKKGACTLGIRTLSVSWRLTPVPLLLLLPLRSLLPLLPLLSFLPLFPPHSFVGRLWCCPWDPMRLRQPTLCSGCRGRVPKVRPAFFFFFLL